MAEQWNKRVVYETIINKKPSVGNPVQILEGGLVQSMLIMPIPYYLRMKLKISYLFELYTRNL